MRGSLSIIGMIVLVAGVFAAEAPGDAPAYKLEYVPLRHVECTLAESVRLQGMSLKEWVYYRVKPPLTPRQQITMTLEPGGREGFEDGPEHRGLLFCRCVLDPAQVDGECSYRVVFRGSLLETRLVALKPGEQPPKVTPLTARDRKLFLGRDDWVDYDSPIVRSWLDREGFHRRAGESELDFARRVFLAMGKTFQWNMQFGMNAKASQTVRDHKAVCAGLSAAYAAALRANGIPARRLGLNEAGANMDAKANEIEHANNEFYIEGIGWVPADMTPCTASGGVEPAALNCFGNDSSGHLILSNGDDDDIVVDTVHFGTRGAAAPAGFRSEFQQRVPDRETGHPFALDVTGPGTPTWKWLQSQWSVRQSADPRAREHIDPGGKSDQQTGQPAFYVWHDESGWHIRTTTEGKPHSFQMKVTADGGGFAKWSLMGGGDQQANLPEIAVGYVKSEECGIDFLCGRGTRAIQFWMSIDNKEDFTRVWIGKDKQHPRMVPFIFAARTSPPVK